MARKLYPINLNRAWIERHAHHSLHLAEDENGRIWLRLGDLKQWVPGLGASEKINLRHPGAVRAIDASRDAYLEANTFIWLTHKSSQPATLKLRAWLMSSVLEPVKRRHQVTQTSALREPEILKQRSPHQMSSCSGGVPKASDMPRFGEGLLRVIPAWLLEPIAALLKRVNPFTWKFTQGRLNPVLLALTGLVGSSFALWLASWLESQAWTIGNDYLSWSWAGITVAVWSITINVAWVLAVLRSAVYRSHRGFNLWLGVAMVGLNLAAAAFMAQSTLHTSTQMVRVWYAVYVQGDPPSRAEWLGGDGNVLRITGALGIGSTHALQDALRTHPATQTIELNSSGGLVIEGFGMLKALEQANIKVTQVRQDCSSACTLLLMAAPERVLIGNASIGFHRSYSVLGDFGSGWTAIEHRAAAIMQARGVSEGFIDRAFSTPGWDMYEATPEEMLAARVVTRVMQREGTNETGRIE